MRLSCVNRSRRTRSGRRKLKLMYYCVKGFRIWIRGQLADIIHIRQEGAFQKTTPRSLINTQRGSWKRPGTWNCESHLSHSNPFAMLLISSMIDGGGGVEAEMCDKMDAGN